MGVDGLLELEEMAANARKLPQGSSMRNYIEISSDFVRSYPPSSLD
jgi:hypothetical protein